jgi:hypothetical protein
VDKLLRLSKWIYGPGQTAKQWHRSIDEEKGKLIITLSIERKNHKRRISKGRSNS